MKLTIDVNSKEFPRFVDRDYDNPLWIECEVEISRNEIKKGKVINITSSGKYIVEILEDELK